MAEQERALRKSVEKGNVEDMTRIINEGVTITTDIDDMKANFFLENQTALVLASKHGHYDCVKRLLELGASIYIDHGDILNNYVAIDFLGAMVAAASQDHLECLQLLAESRILQSCPGDECYTSFLHDTIKHIDESNYVQNLVSRFGDMQKESLLKGWKGQNLISLFLLHKCDISLLFDVCDVSVNDRDFNGLTPLMMAVLTKDLQAASFLLSRGANVELPEIPRLRIFESDGGFGSLERNSWEPGPGRTALMFAACMGNPKMISLLLEFAPSEIVNCREGYKGFTPVMFAAAFGDKESVSLLIDHGADVDIKNEYGISPLDCALISGMVKCVELLLEKTTPSFYRDVFSNCIFHNDPDMLLTIMKYYNDTAYNDPPVQSYLMDAAMFDSLECAQVLIDNGHPVDYKNSDGMTALMLATLENKERIVELLLRRGADMNAKRDTGFTSVMYAVCNNDVKCLKLHLEYEADLDVIGNDKDTIFTIAMKVSSPCLDFLLESGKLFDDSDKKSLKLVHREAMTLARFFDPIPVSNFISAMQHGIFRFEWSNMSSLETICFAALYYGVSPAKLIQNNSTMSLLTYAFQKRENWTVLKYLIANLYFFPEDYTHLIQRSAVPTVPDDESDSEYEYETNSTTPDSFYESISSKPMSLRVWSFLHISRAISLNHCSSSNVQRSSLVDSLPIPESLKMKLSFKSPFSHLCMSEWGKITSTDFHELAELMFDKKSFWQSSESYEKCGINKCKCEGLGHTLTRGL